MARKVHILPPEYRSRPKPRNDEERLRLLCIELGHLRTEIKRLEGLIQHKNVVLLNVADFFEDILANNNPQSIEGLKRWVSRLKGAAEREEPGMLE